MINNERTISEFIDKVKAKFEKYFVAYSIINGDSKIKINIFIDDSDIRRMKQAILCRKINNILKEFSAKSNNKIDSKAILTSNLNEENFWDFLGKRAVILNVPALTSFVKIKLPREFIEIFRDLPNRFKLSDFKRELMKLSNKEYHRNTYQNWIKSLTEAGFVKLKNKTYQKVNLPYKKFILDNIDQ